MTWRRLAVALVCSAIAQPLWAREKSPGPPVEPNAGQWRTWAISSGKDYRAGPPPSPSETREELRILSDLIAGNGPAAAAQIAYWDAGAPQYRWMDLISNRVLAGTPTGVAHRVYTYVAIAMYDATIATWESKYHYQPTASERAGSRLPTAVPVPESPSYPSEHAAAAQAAATVLAYFLPAEAQSSRRWRSRRDGHGCTRACSSRATTRRLDAGRGEWRNRSLRRRIRTARDAPWTGIVPIGPCNWTGTNPGNAAAANWHPLCWHLRANSARRLLRRATRPGAGGDCGRSHIPAHVRHQLQSLLLAESGGAELWPYRYRGQMDVRRSDWTRIRLAPRAPTRSIAAVQFDAFIASQDGKFAYWYIRPPSTRSGDRAAVRSAELSELSVEPLDLLDRARGSARVSVPVPRRLHPGDRQGGRRLADLGRHPLSDGQRGRRGPRKSGGGGVHRLRQERWLPVAEHAAGRERAGLATRPADLAAWSGS